jgi:xylan 1,4-beta-xylosidase
MVSDEATPPMAPNFTGAFLGVCCQDVAGTRRPADFDYFEYRERDYQPQLAFQEPDAGITRQIDA